MELWIFVLVCDLIVPLMMIIMGILLLKRPPKTMNEGYGYRTRMSTKSQEAWEFAHWHMGRLWMWCGSILFVLTVLAMILFINQSEEEINLLGGIICMIQCAALITTLFPTERALRRRFDV